MYFFYNDVLFLFSNRNFLRRDSLIWIHDGFSGLFGIKVTIVINNYPLIALALYNNN